MPNGQHKVTLTVDSSNRFQFTGGTDRHGKCENRVRDGAAPVKITLAAPEGYTITSVDLVGKGSAQMKADVIGDGKSAKIDNKCEDKADVEYTVNVTTSGGINIPCHPRIVNT